MSKSWILCSGGSSRKNCRSTCKDFETDLEVRKRRMEKEGDLHHGFLQGCGQITNGLANRTAAGGSAPENSQVGRIPLLN